MSNRLSKTTSSRVLRRRHHLTLTMPFVAVKRKSCRKLSRCQFVTKVVALSGRTTLPMAPRPPPPGQVLPQPLPGRVANPLQLRLPADTRPLLLALAMYLLSKDPLERTPIPQPQQRNHTYPLCRWLHPPPLPNLLPIHPFPSSLAYGHFTRSSRPRLANWRLRRATSSRSWIVDIRTGGAASSKVEPASFPSTTS